jgi:hypothetical protein
MCSQEVGITHQGSLACLLLAKVVHTGQPSWSVLNGDAVLLPSCLHVRPLTQVGEVRATYAAAPVTGRPCAGCVPVPHRGAAQPHHWLAGRGR